VGGQGGGVRGGVHELLRGSPACGGGACWGGGAWLLSSAGPGSQHRPAGKACNGVGSHALCASMPAFARAGRLNVDALPPRLAACAGCARPGACYDRCHAPGNLPLGVREGQLVASAGHGGGRHGDWSLECSLPHRFPAMCLQFSRVV
jgi:hypothetical protein